MDGARFALFVCSDFGISLPRSHICPTKRPEYRYRYRVYKLKLKRRQDDHRTQDSALSPRVLPLSPGL